MDHNNISDDFNKLLTFLNERKTGGESTHTRMSGGKYFIPSEDEDMLYYYFGAAAANGFDGNDFDLVERHNGKKVASAYHDLDYSFSMEMPEQQYGVDHIIDVIAVYNNVYRDLLQVDEDDLVAVVTRREEPVIDEPRKRVKDGLHIYYPRVVAEPRVHYMVREEVMDRLGDVLSGLPLINLTPEDRLDQKHLYEDVVDKCVIYANGPLMYGCTKPPSKLGPNGEKLKIKPYQIVTVLDADLMEIDIEDNLDNCMNMQEFLSIRRFNETDAQEMTPLGEMQVKKFKNDYDDESKKKVKRIGGKMEIIFNEGVPNRKVDYDINDVQKLLTMLRPSRWEDYSEWTKIGWALRNTDCESKEMFEMFKAFSLSATDNNTGEPYDDNGQCEELWMNAKKNGTLGERGQLVGLGSIHQWAKEDNMEAYFKWKSEQYRPLLEKSMTGTHKGVAAVLHTMFKGKFVYIPVKKNTGFWYVYENNRWRHTKSESAIRMALYNEVTDEYLKIIDELNAIATGDGEDLSQEEREEAFQQGVNYSNLVNCLENTPFVNNVLQPARDMFEDEYFMDKIDEANKDLIGFKNGVYDLANGIFRDGMPEDYISMCTGVDYIEYDPTSDEAIAVMELLASIFPDPEVLEYQLLVLASCLDGHLLEQKFRLWMGVGSNGKGILRKLVDLGFGDYTKTLNATTLTRKPGDAEGANSTIAQTKGCRLVFFDEPDHGDKIYTGTMKKFSGGDPIKARIIYGLPFEFYPQFSMFLLSNVFPEVPPSDKGTWRRMEPTKFVNEFVEGEPEEPHQYKMDKELPKRLPGMAPMFMALLVEKYRKYKTEGITVPKAVRECKREYRRHCDILLDFLDDTICTIENKESKLNIDDLYSDFRYWYRNNNYGNDKNVTKKEFKKYLEKTYKQRVENDDIVGVRYTSTRGNPNRTESLGNFRHRSEIAQAIAVE